MSAKEYLRMKYMILVGVPLTVVMVYVTVHLIFHNADLKQLDRHNQNKAPVEREDPAVASSLSEPLVRFA